MARPKKTETKSKEKKVKDVKEKKTITDKGFLYNVAIKFNGETFETKCNSLDEVGIFFVSLKPVFLRTKVSFVIRTVDKVKDILIPLPKAKLIFTKKLALDRFIRSLNI